MAQDEGGLTQPLLTDSEEDRLWDRVEAAQQGPPGEIDDANAPFEITTVPELLKGNPNQVLRTISAAGVRRLGEFSVRDHLIIGRLKEDTILTMGSKNAVIDYERAWKQELAQSSGCGIFAEDARSNSEANPDEQNGNKDTGWSTQIPVIAYVVTIRNAAAPDTEGLLHPLLCRWQSGGCSFGVFALPAVHAVIEYKWRNYARRALLAELACFLLWLFSFYAFTWLFQDEDTSLSLRELLQTQRGQFAVLFNVLSLLGMAPFVLIEVCSMAAYGLWGWATTWNILDCVTYTIQISIAAMHLGRFNVSSGWLSIAAALQCILLLFRLQYFSRVFTPTRFSFVDDLKEVLQDCKWYLAFLVLITLGYAASFHILFRKDQEEHMEYSTLGRAFIQMVTWAAGNADLSPLYSNTHNPVAACILGCSFVFVLGMVLLNLLISIMSTSLDRVTANEGIRLLLSKAQVIDELEATVPRWIERRFCELFPPFLHVLRIDTHRMDTAAADALWACSADQEGSGNLLDGSSHPQGDFGCAGAGKEGANETQENGGRVVQRIEARAGGSEARDQRPSEGEGVSPRGGHLSESPWGSEAMARMGKLEEQLGEVLYELKVLRDEVRARHARV